MKRLSGESFQVSFFFGQPVLEDGRVGDALILHLLDEGGFAIENSDGLLVVVHQEFT